MDYNTQRTRLVLPEYGRNVQQMIDHLHTIEDRSARSQQALAIIGVMGNLNPHLRDINDFKHKLWDHLHVMSDFRLDIDSPYPKPSPETLVEKPKRVPYPSRTIRYKHYGQSIVEIIERVVGLEDAHRKELLAQMIANHMKKSYLAWNKDTVADEDILRDLSELSGGQLTLSPGYKLRDHKEIVLQPNHQHKGGGRKKHQSRKK